MPPSNITAALATVVSTFPYDFTQTDIHDVTNYTVWYKFVAPTGAVVMSVWGFSGNTNPLNYCPTVKPYTDAGITQLLNISAQNKPIQIPVTVASTYWIKFESNGGSDSGQLRVRVEMHTEQTIAAGDILVNDDTSGFPLAVFPTTEDYTVKAFKHPFPAGEAGDALTSGVMCWEDKSTQNFKLFDVNFTQTYESTAIVSPSVSYDIRRNQSSTNFWIIKDTAAAHLTYFKLTSAGVLTSYGDLDSYTDIGGFCVNSAETIMYFAEGGIGKDIRKWDLVGNVELAVFFTSTWALEQVTELILLSDGNVVVLFYDITGSHAFLRVFNSSGTLVNTFDLGISDITQPRMTWARDNPNSVWVMNHVGITKLFLNVKISDGSILTTRTTQLYDHGAYSSPMTITPTALHGTANSCPIVIMEGTPTVPDLSGIYYINPTGTHDIYYTAVKKIPDPTIRTGLIGE